MEKKVKLRKKNRQERKLGFEVLKNLLQQVKAERRAKEKQIIFEKIKMLGRKMKKLKILNKRDLKNIEKTFLNLHLNNKKLMTYFR